jgi:hypothetical protein
MHLEFGLETGSSAVGSPRLDPWIAMELLIKQHLPGHGPISRLLVQLRFSCATCASTPETETKSLRYTGTAAASQMPGRE